MTNKPEVLGFFVEWSCNNEEGEFKLSLDHFTTRVDYCSIFGGDCRLVPVIRLSDYEALQAECEALREALFEAQSTMTSALSFEPVINEVTKMTLRAEVERIKSLLSEGGNKS